MSPRAFVAISAILLTGGAATALLSQPGPTQKTLQAGDIEVDPTNPHVIRGHFYIGPPKPGQPAISSLGYGGACLIMRHPTDTSSCKSDDDCTKGVPATGYGYCVKEAAQAGQCWIKPDDAAYCYKRRGPGPAWPDGDNTTPKSGWVNVDSEYAKLSAKGPKQISWRVVACLNAYDPAGRSGCAHQVGAPKPLEDFGRPKVIH